MQFTYNELAALKIVSRKAVSGRNAYDSPQPGKAAGGDGLWQSPDFSYLWKRPVFALTRGTSSQAPGSMFPAGILHHAQTMNTL